MMPHNFVNLLKLNIVGLYIVSLDCEILIEQKEHCIQKPKAA